MVGVVVGRASFCCVGCIFIGSRLIVVLCLLVCVFFTVLLCFVVGSLVSVPCLRLCVFFPCCPRRCVSCLLLLLLLRDAGYLGMYRFSRFTSAMRRRGSLLSAAPTRTTTSTT